MTFIPTQQSDCEALLGIFSDADTILYTNFRQFTDTDALGVFLERFLTIGKEQPLQYGPYSIYLDYSLIGLCGAQQQDLQLGISELWYVLHKDYWGKGLAKQAVALLLQECQSNPQLKSLYAEAVDTNTASWRILEKMGFVQTGALPGGFAKGDIVADIRCYSCNFN